jgi:hypothetical protein
VPGARDADEARPGRHTKDAPTPAGKKTARIRKPVWITIGAAALAVIAAVSVFAATDSPSSSPPPKVEKTTTSPAPSARPAVYFHTLPPNAKLPSGATCARLVNESPSPEVRPQNARYNHTTGQHVPASFFPEGDLSQVAELAPLITGDYTGTTEELSRRLDDGRFDLPAGPRPRRRRQTRGVPPELRHPAEQVHLRAERLARPGFVDGHECRCHVRHLAVLLQRGRGLAQQ